MNRLTAAVLLPLLFHASAYATVFNEAQVYAKKVTVIAGDGLGLPDMTGGRLVFTEIGQNRIRALRRIDIVVDRYGQTTGVRLVYENDVSGLKSLYLNGIEAVLIEQDRRPLKKRSITIRTITADELASPW
ncbi:MAG TPA: hypothetical protein ENJ04_10730 [Nitrospirae bacterium]|nr:hypothetical protein [Nitrospirota bacterium]